VSGVGAPQGFDGGALPPAQGKTIAVVQALWHEEITSELANGASSTLARSGAKVVNYQVTGALELPLAAQRAIKVGAHGVVAAGLVLKGETPHFDFVAATTIDSLVGVSLANGAPIGVAVLTCLNLDQARPRCAHVAEQPARLTHLPAQVGQAR
jgi:6,7-dimethyl-8-ribityllumazine synthase